ncbi:MAG: hypothetical protein F6J87_21070 [Spirulina sp. SIO3F2]|nr:hypothetical protein [Spirulina sp. SIO3F2]
MQEQPNQNIILIQNFFERRFTEHYLEYHIDGFSQDDEYDDDDYDKALFEDFFEISWDDFNIKMKHFSDGFEHELRHGDGLGVNIYQIIVQDFDLIACVMGTDGDNSWLFVFSANGEILTAGYTYLDVIEWVSAATVQRYQSQPLDGLFTEIVSLGCDRGRALWGRSFEEAEVMVKQRMQAWEARQA